MKTREEVIEELEAAYSGDLDPEARAAVLEALGLAYDAGYEAGQSNTADNAVIQRAWKNGAQEAYEDSERLAFGVGRNYRLENLYTYASGAEEVAQQLREKALDVRRGEHRKEEEEP